MITARRSLPSGRALIGALLVTAAALGSFALATAGDDTPSTSYLVLQHDVAAGEQIAPTAARLEPMELSEALVATSMTSTGGLEGATALRDLRAGEILSANDLVTAHSIDGKPLVSIHELAFGIPLDRTPPGIVRGDRVTIVGTVGDVSIVAVEDATVLAVDTEPKQIGATGRGILTLAVDDAELALSIAHLTQTAELTIIRSTRAIDDVYPESTAQPKPTDDFYPDSTTEEEPTDDFYPDSTTEEEPTDDFYPDSTTEKEPTGDLDPYSAADTEPPGTEPTDGSSPGTGGP